MCFQTEFLDEFLGLLKQSLKLEQKYIILGLLGVQPQSAYFSMMLVSKSIAYANFSIPNKPNFRYKYLVCHAAKMIVGNFNKFEAMLQALALQLIYWANSSGFCFMSSKTR